MSQIGVGLKRFSATHACGLKNHTPGVFLEYWSAAIICRGGAEERGGEGRVGSGVFRFLTSTEVGVSNACWLVFRMADWLYIALGWCKYAQSILSLTLLLHSKSMVAGSITPLRKHIAR